jgi:hypothetical protein
MTANNSLDGEGRERYPWPENNDKSGSGLQPPALMDDVLKVISGRRIAGNALTGGLSSAHARQSVRKLFSF